MSAPEFRYAPRRADSGFRGWLQEWSAGGDPSVRSRVVRRTNDDLRCLRHLRVRGSTKTKRHWTCAWRPGAKAPACLVFAARGGRCSIFLALRCPAGNCSASLTCGSPRPALRAGRSESLPALTRSTWVSGTLYQSRHFPPCRCAARRGPRGFFGRGSLSERPARTAGRGLRPPTAAGRWGGLWPRRGAAHLARRTTRLAPPDLQPWAAGAAAGRLAPLRGPQTLGERRAKLSTTHRLHVSLQVQSTRAQGAGLHWARWNCCNALPSLVALWAQPVRAGHACGRRSRRQRMSPSSLRRRGEFRWPWSLFP